VTWGAALVSVQQLRLASPQLSGSLATLVSSPWVMKAATAKVTVASAQCTTVPACAPENRANASEGTHTTGCIARSYCGSERGNGCSTRFRVG
jgi:hypothetical protein